MKCRLGPITYLPFELHNANGVAGAELVLQQLPTGKIAIEDAAMTALTRL
jgi:hypothetical protein